jgi:hypothetical protein
MNISILPFDPATATPSRALLQLLAARALDHALDVQTSRTAYDRQRVAESVRVERERARLGLFVVDTVKKRQHLDGVCCRILEKVFDFHGNHSPFLP